MKITDTQEALYRQSMNSTALCSWRVVAASVCGTSHEKVGQFCQDAHYWQNLPEGVLLAAVADGAGSASLGKIGAIVAVQTAIETMSLEAAKLKQVLAAAKLQPENDTEWQTVLTNALQAANSAVQAEAEACKVAARELASTLILVVATPDVIAAAQIGDGVAIAADNQGNVIALTAPQHGEFINETTFLVSPNALETAQLSLWRGAITNIAIMSDGLQMLALDMSDGKPHAPFFSPLFKFIKDVKNENEAKEQLVSFLRSERITQRADDDLTLLLATIY